MSRKPTLYKSYRLVDFTVFDAVEKDDEGVAVGGAKFVIQMFGINERGETCSIRVNDYRPFFFVKVMDDWKEDDITQFVGFIERSAGVSRENIQVSLVQHHKLYGFDGGRKYKFIKFEFKTTGIMNRVKNLWYFTVKGERRLIKLKYNSHHTTIDLELYEAGIPPLLRYFHIENISPSGWVKLPLRCHLPAEDTAKTSCTMEYECSRRDIKPIAEKETRVPYKIMSFDIEASSSHGDFPIPKKTYKRLATNMVDVLAAAATTITTEYTGMVVRKSIEAAFGYDEMDGIDKVYPKNHPSPEQLNTLIRRFMSAPINVDAATIAAAKNTVQNMFERLQSQTYYSGTGAAATAGGADDADGGGAEEGGEEIATPACGGGGGDTVFEVIEEEDDVIEENDAGISSPSPSPPPPPPPLPVAAGRKRTAAAAAPVTTISNVLSAASTYCRDDKIKTLDYLFQESHFPELEGDKVTFIGSTFMSYGDIEPYKNHCIVLGSCDPVENAVIECTETEQELLMKWKELVVSENPDIIIGYNIFGFDYEFMFRRAEENYCAGDFLEMTRILGEKSGKERAGRIENIEQTNVVLASGEYELKYFKMTGRIQIDMYTYLRRDYNLSSYKLDDVAGQFIGDDIKKIEIITTALGDNITELYTNNITGLHANDFIHIEITGFTTDYYGEKHRILDIIPVTNHASGASAKLCIAGHHNNIDVTKSIRWGLAKDDVSPQDIFRMTNEGPAARAVVAKYCIQDCNLVHHLLNKIDVITGYNEMSRICSVPISFLVFRGQGIKLTSYVAKKCREKDTLMPDLPKLHNDDGYEGAIVLPPKCSMYIDNPVACVDYASLYPSSMISENLSHDSKVWTKEYDLTGKLLRETGVKHAAAAAAAAAGGATVFAFDNLPGYEYVDIEFDTYRYMRKSEKSRAEKTKVGKMVCRWAQFPDGKKGIMPSILEELLHARASTRKLIKTEKDPFMQNILDKRQLGYKVTANSLYGQCGAQTSTFYEKDIAASTTATGRKMIIYAKRMIEEVYGNRIYDTLCHGEVRTNAEYVYGDTDSVFFTFNLKDTTTGENIRGKKALEITIEIAQDVAQLCTKYLKTPMELTYEKTLMPFILLSKKRYVGMLYETNPNKGKLKYMGLSLKRRDACDYLKDTYGNIIKMLMRGETIHNTLAYLDSAMLELSEGRVSIEKLMLTRSLRSDYKDPQRIAHRVLADRIAKRDPGNKPKSGDRLRFVFIVNNTPKVLLGERIETPEFIAENSLKIDYIYYITNQLMKPLQQLFGLAIEDILKERHPRSADALIRRHRRELAAIRNEYVDFEVYTKKKELFCSKEIKKELFDKMLVKIQNERCGNREITLFFSQQPRK